MATTAGVHPTEVDRRKLRKVDLHHLSWTQLLSEAMVQKEHRGVSDPEQAWILGELIRLLSAVRDNPDLLVDPDRPELVRFRVALAAPMGLKRGAGKGGFISALLDLTDAFYETTVQNLRPWTPSAPKLQRSTKPAAEQADDLGSATEPAAPVPLPAPAPASTLLGQRTWGDPPDRPAP